MTFQKKGGVGKRLGMKRCEGMFVKAGEIIIRQRGRAYRPGKNTGMGRDFTIYSLTDGKIVFEGGRRISVIPASDLSIQGTKS